MEFDTDIKPLFIKADRNFFLINKNASVTKTTLLGKIVRSIL